MGANASTANPPPPPIAASTPSTGPSQDSGSQATCPVDHKTRAVWLSQHKNSDPPHPIPPTDAATKPTDTAKPPKQLRPLSQDREVSSIPRAIPDPSTAATSSASAAPPPSPYAAHTSTTASHIQPSNDEAETGHDPRTGNWIYPSERQFFEALLRKNTPTSATSAKDLATSVASIIPIHNAVNERAWSEILEWESSAPVSDPGSRKCGGPKLYSFRGLGVDSQFLSPRARINGLLGYQLPFDRHDWVVERCGGAKVEYVIDFYQGRAGGAGLGTAANNAKLSFYLDVRPKLNTWEGWRMRASRLVGLG
ncbi:cytochrome c heme-lyase [Blastomyces parvus]|uniref:Holocytochrome c-type synthase n=1 Tax=Blastomyces parvus TaxID=2060905 RepID=A0A2B7XG33_9EURO|nr:cytochrome c heme-lyase [Blastomyces parvus]